MRVISFVSQKGGSGKSTLCMSLAVAAQEAGATVLAIDADPQSTLATWAKSRTGRPPAVATLPGPNHLSDLLQEASSRFSLTLIDTPGRDDMIGRAAMAAANLTLIPIRPTRADGHGASPTIQACRRAHWNFALVLNQCATTIFSTRASEMAGALSAVGILAQPMIGLRVDYQDAYAAAEGPTEYNPNGKAAAEIRQLWSWIDEELKP